jgi:DNA-binding NarL/FixJ family response regulator
VTAALPGRHYIAGISHPIALRSVPIQVVSVEDDARYRASLVALLRQAPGFALAASFDSADAALDELESIRRRSAVPGWNLVLMDLALPGIGGVEATRRIKQLLPDIVIVALTVFETPATVLEAICAGADGYMLKRTPPQQLLEQLRQVMDGGAPLSAGIARTILELLRRQEGTARGRLERLDLTTREQEVLRLLVQGGSYKQTARQLGISIDTVRTHVKSIYGKLQVHSVAAAVGRAVREGLV